MANVYIVERVYVDSKNVRKLFFTLNDGSTISEREALSGIKNGKIYKKEW